MLTAAVFQTRDRHHIQCTASTLAFQWRAPPTMMSSLRFYSSSMKIRRNYLHKRTIHLPRCNLNQIQFPQPRNLHHQPSFWAEVYTLQPPHALMGILTDLHVHRFVLHQHLDSLNALTDTPIGHQPLTDTLPPPVQRLIAIYHNNVQRIQSHARLALNAIDTMARFPPAAYFMDPNLAAQTSPTTHTETDPPPSSTSPLRFYPIPTAAARPTTLQDVATQTPPLSESILANPLPPLLMHESQQTTPRATPRATTHHRHIQTDIHAIVQLPSFAGLIPTADTNQPTTSLPTASSTFPTASPNPTSATNKQPHDRWQYVNLIPTPTVTLPEQPHTPPTFPSPIGGTPRNKRSKTPPRTTTPTRTRQPDPRTGSPTPQSTASATNRQSTATVHPLPKRPPPSLYQASQHHVTTEPLQPVPPATGWPCFQGGSHTPTPSVAPPTAFPSPTHPWPAHYHLPAQQPSPFIPPQAGSSDLGPPPPVVMLHPSTTRVDTQGRPLPLSHQNYDPATDPWHADNQ